ncbi:MAG: hypothetical protein FWC43_04195 [Planctomycetaceae bacterium]|nr:hypothetical protein [Planctomycetaceae bacterium]
MKTITSYSLSTRMGHALGNDDVLWAIIVSSNDGGVQFCEGENGLNRVYLSGEAIKGFKIEKINRESHLILTFTRNSSEENYFLGKIVENDLAFAKSWIESVNRIYLSRSFPALVLLFRPRQPIPNVPDAQRLPIMPFHP